jgi:hypothetical protein
MVLVFAGATLQFCSNDDSAEVQTSEVSFDANLLASTDITASKNPVANIAAVHLILDVPNRSVPIEKELHVILGSSGFRTEPIDLLQGEYRIREFTARDVDGAVLYALQINRPNNCDPDRNVLKTFYAGASSKTIALNIHSTPPVVQSLN